MEFLWISRISRGVLEFSLGKMAILRFISQKSFFVMFQSEKILAGQMVEIFPGQNRYETKKI